MSSHGADTQIFRLTAYGVLVLVYSFQTYFTTTLKAVSPKHIIECPVNQTPAVNVAPEVVDSLIVSEIVVSWLIILYSIRCMFLPINWTMAGKAMIPMGTKCADDEIQHWLPDDSVVMEEDVNTDKEKKRILEESKKQHRESYGSFYKYILNDSITAQFMGMFLLVIMNFLYSPEPIVIISMTTVAGMMFFVGAIMLAGNDFRQMTYSPFKEQVMDINFGSKADGLMVVVVENAMLFSGAVFFIKASTVATTSGYVDYLWFLLVFYIIIEFYKVFFFFIQTTHWFTLKLVAIVIGALSLRFCDPAIIPMTLIFFASGIIMLCMNVGFVVVRTCLFRRSKKYVAARL